MQDISFGILDANSQEFDNNTENQLIHIMEEQKNIDTKGATMRLGNYPCVLSEGSLARKVYGEEIIEERHRHRYECNNEYVNQLEEAGLKISGKSPNGLLVEIVEIPTHKYFIAAQFHPELKSRPDKPSPLFVGLIEACKNK